MSSFGPKRKARVIQPLEDDDADLKPSSDTGEEQQSDQSAPPGRIKFGRNKPAKSSALRKSFNPNDDDEDGQEGSASAPAATARDGDEDGRSSAPVVVRPVLGRSGSSRLKKRPSSSRLSFGTNASTADEDEEDNATPSVVAKPFTPKKPLGQRLLEKNALRRTSSLQSLTGRLPVRFGGEEERPKYSKEYLEELQSSTPNTPQNLASLQIRDDGDEMELDESELEGALVVQQTDVAATPPASTPTAAAHILTEAEIRERKERRARLAKEAEFISLEDGSDDEETERGQGGRMSVNLPSKKKRESRLIAEDEDLGEGYDEFVSDGGLALGKKAEREAAKRHRQEMAELIHAAEEGSDAETDDSEAERRAAYEAAQRRAGMDGLHRPHDPDGMDLDGSMTGPDAIPRMKPLPKMNEVLQRMRDIVRGLEDQVTRKRARIEDLEKEKEEILAREKEVQEILNQAGAKYQAVVASAGGQAGDVEKIVSGQSPLRPLPPGIVGDFQPVERGLESFGATPTRRDDMEMA
ncbi:nineteen complex-related protein 2-domain-containing protein [Chaetomium strumarium]|uniref:Nineteen complex-related protein 2-domain-containing protein n=1 Tax=Chaetomium strumarium TaxID=1170767 RepID=A0AAJ0H040_9PEZI|nr:nineteen complex-related protein 2-domain-containing protein [Chaetomium strumarium]